MRRTFSHRHTSALVVEHEIDQPPLERVARIIAVGRMRQTVLVLDPHHLTDPAAAVAARSDTAPGRPLLRSPHGDQRGVLAYPVRSAVARRATGLRELDDRVKRHRRWSAERYGGRGVFDELRRGAEPVEGSEWTVGVKCRGGSARNNTPPACAISRPSMSPLRSSRPPSWTHGAGSNFKKSSGKPSRATLGRSAGRSLGSPLAGTAATLAFEPVMSGIRIGRGRPQTAPRGCWVARRTPAGRSAPPRSPAMGW